jgi:hypothetical protein
VSSNKPAALSQGGEGTALCLDGCVSTIGRADHMAGCPNAGKPYIVVHHYPAATPAPVQATPPKDKIGELVWLIEQNSSGYLHETDDHAKGIFLTTLLAHGLVLREEIYGAPVPAERPQLSAEQVRAKVSLVRRFILERSGLTQRAAIDELEDLERALLTGEAEKEQV